MGAVPQPVGRAPFRPSVVEGAGAARKAVSGPRPSMIPVMGRIAAGTSIEAIEHETHRVAAPDDELDPDTHFALEVQGESMKPLYRDGDILIVEPGAQVRRGDRVVVKTREGEVMAKILARQSAKSIELQSLNPEHPPRSLEMSDVEWVARIIWASQ